MSNWMRGAGIFACTGITFVFAAFAGPRTLQAEPFRINVMLCDSPEHAIAYTVAMNNGATEEEAKDRVGKQAGDEACGRFFGLASVDRERTMTENGITYLVRSYDFSGVGDIKWSAIPQD